ncbi:hypothetical protein [Gymnodinialimonas sp. 57CJ19]|uniref:hypothetical protein n=1 Tax=Gymnodinialimonas sp. 57CJ19 TaxID=3138498 RepID=UPI00313434F2
MIRAALSIACALALPVQGQAQDFRGLLPGMPASELAVLGEPFDFQSQQGTVTARYPLPYERHMTVLYENGRIQSLGLGYGGIGTTLHPPATQGLRVGVTTLREAVALAGSEGFTFDDPNGLRVIGDVPIGWFLYYELQDHPDLLLELSFQDRSLATARADSDTGPTPLPRDALLVSATLYHDEFTTRHPDVHGSTPMDRPGAVPFALPLSEAFPLTVLP